MMGQCCNLDFGIQEMIRDGKNNNLTAAMESSKGMPKNYSKPFTHLQPTLYSP